MPWFECGLAYLSLTVSFFLFAKSSVAHITRARVGKIRCIETNRYLNINQSTHAMRDNNEGKYRGGRGEDTPRVLTLIDLVGRTGRNEAVRGQKP